MHMRFTTAHYSALRQHLTERRDVETAALLYVRRPHEGAEVLTVEQVIPWPENGYLDRRGDHLHLDPQVLVHLTKPARTNGWSVFTVHSHPGCDDPWFSHADDAGDAVLMASFQGQMPGRIHGSLVMTGTGRLTARWFDNGLQPHLLRVSVVGARIDHPVIEAAADAEMNERDDRQVLALGEDGLRRLRRSRVAVVGMGGLGSEVSKSLVHLGIGHLVAIDGDVVEVTNLPRIVGATSADVQAGTPKVEVAARYAAAIGSPTQVQCIHQHLDDRLLSVVAGCDLVVLCVDRHTPRAQLNRLAYEAHIPAIDCGVGFRVDAHGALCGDAGRVVIVGPGRPCLACWGHLDPVALREEALPVDQREALDREGYIQGAAVAQPAVMCFNAVVGNAAVIEVLRIIAGFADGEVHRLAFSFSKATFGRNAIRGTGECRICRWGR